MYESYEILKMKEKAGIESAQRELHFRKTHREKIALQGLERTMIYMVRTGDIQERLVSIDNIYRQLNGLQKVKEVILLDAYHSATIEGARTTVENLFLFLDKKEYNIWLRTGIFHFYFAYIHPFCDGNGRLARILTQSYLYHNGMEKIKYLPVSRTVNQNLAGYYQTLRESETIHANGQKWIDITSFLDYFLQILEESMLISIKEDHLLSEREKKLIGKMKKRGKGAEINRTAAAKILGISEQTAGKLLNTLTEKNYLDKVRRGRRKPSPRLYYTGGMVYLSITQL